MEADLTIQSMALRYGLSLRTIRFYEERHMLSPRRMGSKRIYGPREQRRLELIIQGKDLGFSLKEISALMSNFAKRPLGDASIATEIGHSAISAHLATLEARKLSLEKTIETVKAFMVA